MSSNLLRNPYVGVSIAASLLAIVSATDHFSGPDVTFSLFYILIVAYVAWITRNLQLALSSAVIAGLVWLVADWFTFGAARPVILLWNAVTRLVILITVGLLISRLRRALDTEKALARTDFLTGALNSRAFTELAKAELRRARRFEHSLALVYIDVDDFKDVNDRMGHLHGDGVLREVARVLLASTRATDAVARMGGDEFVLLLPETGRSDAERVVDKVCAALEEAMRGNAWSVTFSIGIAAYATPPEDVNLLIRAADSLMYEAKAQGKNRVRIDDSAC